MARFRRVNLDGKSITETRLAAANIEPGTFVAISNGQFVAVTTPESQLYVVMPAYHQGQGIEDVIAAGEMAVADYAEEGREFALVLPAGTYKKDDKITITATGNKAAAAGDMVIALVQEDVTLAAADFVRCRINRIATTKAASGS